MGREMIRKNNKKSKKSNVKKELSVNDTITYRSALKIFIFSIVLIVAIYFTIAIFVTKELKVTWFNNENAESENTGVENRILAKNTFSQKEDTYYVYFYNFKNEDTNIANALYKVEDAVYHVDASSGLNSNYVTKDAGNRNATSFAELKVVDPTLIKVENDKITAYYEGPNEILNFLN